MSSERIMKIDRRGERLASFVVFLFIVAFISVAAAGVYLWDEIRILFWLLVTSVPLAFLLKRKVDNIMEREVRDAKYFAYTILDEFGTVHLRESTDHYRLARLKERKEIEEIAEVLSKRHSDREARHLLYDLYELEHELEQMPDNQEEEDDKDRDSPLKAMSTEDLLAFKAKYPHNQSIQKIINEILDKRGKATGKSQG